MSVNSTTTRWSAKGSIISGMAALILLVGGFVAWATLTDISGAVVATGQVEVEQNRQVVQHPDGGVVLSISVQDGTEVVAGESLLMLDGTMLETEHRIVEGQYFEILARRARLEAERADAETITFSAELMDVAETTAAVADLIEGQRSLFTTRLDTIQKSLDQLEQQSGQIDSEVDGIDAQIVAMRTQRELIAEELRAQQSLLDRGLAQASRVLGLEREAASMDGELGSLQSRRASASIRQGEIEIQRLQLAAQRREKAETELRDLGERELELAERRRSLVEQIDRLEIRAPVSGIVYDMKVSTPRSVIRPADPLLHIIPQDRPLVIGARVATINVDEVQPGQDVVLRFSAFSSRTTPEIHGVLSRVSADALIDEATRSPYYRAEISISPEELAKLGDAVLVPGMPAEVYIQTGDRSPMAYLVKPLADYFVRAFRES